MSTAVRELTLIVTDLYLDAEAREAFAQSEAGTGRLPALELLMTRALDHAEGDWRHWICRDRPQPPSIAAVSRLAPHSGSGAVPQRATWTQSGQWWILSSALLEAGHDHVQLAALADLDETQWRMLAGSFATEFGEEVGELIGGAGEQAYLLMREQLDAHTHDPARVVGHDVHDYLPTGPAGATLRRLMTELQMWLHEHPLNRERTARGLPPITGLWIWGGAGGSESAVASPADLPTLLSNDPFLRGFWVMHGIEPGSLDARRYAAALGQPRARLDPAARNGAQGSREGSLRDSLVVGLSLRSLEGNTWQERLRELDHQWLAPALEALRRGRFDLLRLLANDRSFSLTRTDLWRFWRRPQPWLEKLAGAGT